VCKKGGEVTVKGISRTKVLLALALLAALMGACFWMVSTVDRIFWEAHTMWRANSFFVSKYGRMPKSLDELIASGYLKRITWKGVPMYQAFLNGAVRNFEHIEISWGVDPGDLIVRDGRVYYRDRPNEEAFLIMYTSRLLRFLFRKGERSYSLSLYNDMAQSSECSTR